MINQIHILGVSVKKMSFCMIVLRIFFLISTAFLSHNWKKQKVILNVIWYTSFQKLWLHMWNLKSFNDSSIDDIMNVHKLPSTVIITNFICCRTSVSYTAEHIHIIQNSQVSLADSGYDAKSFTGELDWKKNQPVNFNYLR